MPKTKEQKQKIINDLKEKIARQKAMVFVDLEGMNSKALFQLRDELKKNDCNLQIVKKTLFRKALEALSIEKIAEKIAQVEKQLALAFGFDDEISPAKTCYEFSKTNENLKILGGVIENEFIEKEKMLELAQIPSRAELLARLVGSLQAPVSNFVYTLKGNIKGLVYVLANAKT